MEVRSLAYRTDLFFPRFDGIIKDRRDYLVVLTPSNPTYYWGNFLLFSRPPQPGDLTHWKALFAQEIGTPPQAGHFTFGWDTTDGTTGEIGPFVEEGFHVDEDVVLTAEGVCIPPKRNQEAVLKPLIDDWEWEAALQCANLCREHGHSEGSYIAYLRPKMARYRAMVQAGLGAWFGAFIDEELVAHLGLFVMEGIGRFQSVATHPRFRRRGLCGTLVHYAANYGRTHFGAQRLVMVADAHYHAARIYESVGFMPTERRVSLTWWRE